MLGVLRSLEQRWFRNDRSHNDISAVMCVRSDRCIYSPPNRDDYHAVLGSIANSRSSLKARARGASSRSPIGRSYPWNSGRGIAKQRPILRSDQPVVGVYDRYQTTSGPEDQFSIFMDFELIKD